MNVKSLINEGVELFKNKKFDEAIEKLNQALGKIEDKNSQIQEQNVIQLGLGRCYFEQAMKAKGKESEQLLSRAVEHFQRLLEFTKQLEDKQNRLQQQIYAQSWLGRCYLEQAKQAKGKESEQLLSRAVEHFQRLLEFTKQLEDKQNRLQQQIYAQSWLGRCYLEQAKQAKEKDSKQLFEQAVEHHQQQLGLAEQLADEQNHLQEQINAQSWLGRCYLEQAKQAKEKDSKQLFERAVEHHQQQLGLAEQLADEQNRLQEQINAQSWLGRCYFEQAMKTEGKEAAKLFEQAVEHFEPQLELAKQLTDEQNHLRQQNNAQLYLGRCYFEQAKIQQKWERYFDWKKQKIQGDLFGTQEGTQKEKTVIDGITTILAVLNIPPMELGSIPLAHYTSPSVCERLFGIVSDKTNDKADDSDPVDSNKVSLMRIGSSTYMNDPTEGEGLLELLDLQDLELENKANCPDYNAFFTCFSSRVNDLNQFRLYGKENGVEASGCCLVFNKEGNWLKESDVSASFRSMVKKGGDGYSGEQLVEADVPNSDFEDDNLPLYQVAYIAYYDEYIAKEKCTIWLPDVRKPKFGIRLKPVGKNLKWHKFRVKELRAALMKLIKNSNKIKNEDRKALEYIRYLFKDFAFRDEEEFRLLKIEQIGSKDIKYCQTTKSVYLPYADIRDIVDEVILGTNYEKSGKERKAEVFQHLMRNYYPNVKVSRSSLPINANPPIKKD